jgi:ubiquinone/menaquinone biosynthesis C-methylase UbiE
MDRDLVRAGYATVADAYATELLGELAGKPLDRAFLDAFAETVTGRVADLGCGPGQIAAYIHARGATVEGLDLSPEMIAQATAAHPAIEFRVGDMFALPYADASLRRIVAFYAIVHTPTAELDFREFHRVLAPHGLVGLAFHVGESATHVAELFGRPTSLDFYFHPTDAVIAALAAADLVLEARLEREPYANAEHPSKRAYLLARKR